MPSILIIHSKPFSAQAQRVPFLQLLPQNVVEPIGDVQIQIQTRTGEQTISQLPLCARHIGTFRLLKVLPTKLPLFVQFDLSFLNQSHMKNYSVFIPALRSADHPPPSESRACGATPRTVRIISSCKEIPLRRKEGRVLVSPTYKDTLSHCLLSQPLVIL